MNDKNKAAPKAKVQPKADTIQPEVIEGELEERSAFRDAIVGGAQATGRGALGAAAVAGMGVLAGFAYKYGSEMAVDVHSARRTARKARKEAKQLDIL